MNTLMAFEEGQRAFFSPKNKGNPYNQVEEKDLFHAWLNGYNDASAQVDARKYGED